MPIQFCVKSYSIYAPSSCVQTMCDVCRRVYDVCRHVYYVCRDVCMTYLEICAMTCDDVSREVCIPFVETFV